MTWAEMMEILDYLTPRLRDVGRWSEEQIYAFYEDLRRYEAKAVAKAVEEMYADGIRISNGGAVLKQLRATGARPAIDAPTEGHEHLWAIVEYETSREDGKRLGFCVFQPYEGADRCGIERIADPEKLRTLLEIRSDSGEEEIPI